jgi:nuclear pore complex protein Nup205
LKIILFCRCVKLTTFCLIQAELEEIESRVEAYPETRAFMKLLANLTSYPVPGNLGAGYRVPGFEPYLDFLRDSVLMKFKTRAYLDPNEKVVYCSFQH